MLGKKVTAGRTTASTQGDVVVLLIGMRINHFWAVHHWGPVLLAMPRMLRSCRGRRSGDCSPTSC